MLSAHVLVTGPYHDLRRYLLDRSCQELVCTWHPLEPFASAGERRSGCEQYRRGQRVFLQSCRQPPLPGGTLFELLLFAWHALLTTWWGITRGGGATVLVAINPLNAFTGLLLRQLGCVRRVVYYVIDYVPTRYPNRWLNQLYHSIDRHCVRHADHVWNLSSRMVQAREARGLPACFRERQITVPIGTDLRIQPLTPDRVDRQVIVYFGGLMEKQGVQLAIEALAELRRTVPRARLLVIGGGDVDRARSLQQLAASLGVSEAVEFTGVIRDHDEALKRIRRCAVGVAPYTDDPDNFTRYTDPGKPKAYMAAGLPVVMTDVPEVAQLIAHAGAGFVVPYEARAFATALERLLTDELLFATCKSRARQLAEEYDWHKIFDRAFEALDAISQN